MERIIGQSGKAAARFDSHRDTGTLQGDFDVVYAELFQCGTLFKCRLTKGVGDGIIVRHTGSEAAFDFVAGQTSGVGSHADGGIGFNGLCRQRASSPP